MISYHSLPNFKNGWIKGETDLPLLYLKRLYLDVLNILSLKKIWALSHIPLGEHHRSTWAEPPEKKRGLPPLTLHRDLSELRCVGRPRCARERDAIHAATQKSSVMCRGGGGGEVEGVGGYKQPVRHARGCCWHRRGVCFSPAMCGVREKRRKNPI